MRGHLLAAWLLACGVVWAVPAPAAPDAAAALSLPADVSDSLRGIDPERIRAHVKFLADDLLEGRGPGTRGGDLAAKYIATQFALLGLKPAGDDGSYLQKVDFKGVLTQAGTTAAMQPAQGGAVKFALGEDFVTSNQTQTESADIDAPIVFVGYGIAAPEYRWDDYQGVDVKGKVVLVIVNEPPSNDLKFFNGEALTYYGRWTYKFEQAARRGAVGALIIHRTDLASYGWDVVRNSWSNEQVYLAADKDPKLKSAAWIQLEAARKIFAASNLKLDDMLLQAGQRGFKARELPVRFTAHVVSKVRRFVSYNVLAIQPGSAAGASQAVVYSAHYDHLGIDPHLKGDQIYNGAVDNATGCGVLLEMAHAFATSRAHAPHPVLFAAVTAEEKGLLGSEYLGKHLPIPPGQVALDLNYDAIAPLGMPESIAVTGADRTSFYPTVQKTAAAFGYEIQADAEPGAGHYYRSDHFSLAREGVPAFSIDAGIKFAGHTAAWGKQQSEDYNDKRYHRPGDEYRESMDFSTDAELAKFGLALGWQALTAPSTVQWRAGDEFEARRLQGAPR
jgi:Zn-dependent M28 family amino/carboxypeptidase